MKKCRPAKWVPWALVGAGLPFLAATFITTDGLKNDLSARTASAVSANPALSWATVGLEGRDAVITGNTVSQAAIDDAVKAVAGTYGVRTVNVQAKLVEMAAPTVESIASDTATPEIRGTWPADVAKTLAVTVAGATYKLGANPELTSEGNNWALKLATPLADGDFDVTAEVSDGFTTVKPAAAPGKISVKLPPPPDAAGPTVPVLAAAAAGAVWPYALTGSFDEADTKRLTASVDGRTYELNRGSALTSDGKGTFTFQPARKFAPGSYDVDFTAYDSVGNATPLKAAAAIVVPEPAVVAPAPAPEVEKAPEPAPAVEADVTAPPPPVLAPVTAGTPWPYAITGTYDPVDTKRLTATVDGRSYEMDKGAALTSDGKGGFTFMPSRKFAPGSYDVDFSAIDGAGNVTPFKAAAAIVVPEPPPPAPPPDVEGPAAPALAPVTTGAIWPYAITGTYNVADTKRLTATVDGRTYEMDKGAALASDGKGGFTFAPARKFAPGSYDVDFTVYDSVGNATALKAPAAIVVPAPLLPPSSPTVESQLDLTGAPVIKGTWSGAEKLAVTVDGRTYGLGVDANLRSDDKGNWRLMPSPALKDGVYDVVATASNAAGAASDSTTNELEVDGTVPAAPVVTGYSGTVSPASISGTWDEKEAKTLKVTVPALNVAAELGVAESGLASDGNGNWTLALPQTLASGTYDVLVQSGDSRQRMQDDGTSGEIIITAAGTTAPAAAPYDCVGLLNRIGTVFPMRFITDTTDFQLRFGLSVNQYAALLKDPRCTNIHVEIGGHTDSRASDGYNQSLSDRRAAKVADMLREAGVDPVRITSRGYGESIPLDAANTEDARAINRRVEVKITKQ